MRKGLGEGSSLPPVSEGGLSFGWEYSTLINSLEGQQNLVELFCSSKILLLCLCSKS